MVTPIESIDKLSAISQIASGFNSVNKTKKLI